MACGCDLILCEGQNGQMAVLIAKGNKWLASIKIRENF